MDDSQLRDIDAIGMRGTIASRGTARRLTVACRYRDGYHERRFCCVRSVL